MKNWSIRTRAMILSGAPFLFLCIVLCVFTGLQRVADINAANQTHAQTLIKTYAKVIGNEFANAETTPTDRFDTPPAAIKQYLDQLLQENAVRSTNIYDREQQLQFTFGPTMLPMEGNYSVFPKSKSQTPTFQKTHSSIRSLFPIDTVNEQGETINYGWLELEMMDGTSLVEKYHSFLVLLALCVAAMLINAAITFWVSRNLSNAIEDAASTLTHLSQDDYKIPTNLRQDQEFTQLYNAINTLHNSIQQNRSELQHNIDQVMDDHRETLETIEIQNIELDLARKEAIQASRIKSEFLANMSHEIRTPLNGIIGFTKLLLKSELTHSQEDYLETIQKSSESLLAIINDLLDFSKIEAGKLSLDMQPLNLQDVVEDVLGMLSPLAQEKRLEQISLFYSDVPTHIIGDPLRLRQILTNLVNNALKFTEQGEVVVRVMLDDLQDDTALIKVSVTDTGIGLSEEQQEQLFEAFRQADPTTARRFGGTGLGLVISKYLVEQMQGSIELDSTINQGSTFWFNFRAKVQKNQEDIAPLHNNRRATFLVYDANPSVRAAVKNALHKMQVDIQEFSDLAAVQTTLAQNTNSPLFDAAIIGISPTKPNYIELSTLLTEHSAPYPVIALGNHSDQSVIANMNNGEAPPLIPKPFNQKKAFTVIRRLLDKPNNYPLSTNDPSPLSVSEQEQPAYRAPEKPLQVIAVDDVVANLKLISVLLEDLGIAVTPCDSGEKCLEFMGTRDYDLVLMDVQMPTMDGLETTQHIRALEKAHQHVPIVAVTAHAMASERSTLLKSGMDDYVTKPIDTQQLIHIINRWTNRTISADAGTLLPITSSIENAAVDIAMGIRLANGKEDLATEILAMLIDSLPQEQQDIQTCFEQKDYANLLEHVHRLHGGTRYTGTPKLQIAAKELEESIKKRNYEQLNQHMNTLLQEIDAVLRWSKEHRMG